MGKNNYQDRKGAKYKYSSGSLDICTRDEVHQDSKERHEADQIGDRRWRGHNIQMHYPMEIGHNGEVCAARAASQHSQNCKWTLNSVPTVCVLLVQYGCNSVIPESRGTDTSVVSWNHPWESFSLPTCCKWPYAVGPRLCLAKTDLLVITFQFVLCHKRLINQVFSVELFCTCSIQVWELSGTLQIVRWCRVKILCQTCTFARNPKY